MKIADFGRSKHMYQRDYYRESQADEVKPFKWLAIECLRDGVYGVKSDVVSTSCMYYSHIDGYNYRDQ